MLDILKRVVSNGGADNAVVETVAMMMVADEVAGDEEVEAAVAVLRQVPAFANESEDALTGRLDTAIAKFGEASDWETVASDVAKRIPNAEQRELALASALLVMQAD